MMMGVRAATAALLAVALSQPAGPVPAVRFCAFQDHAPSRVDSEFAGRPVGTVVVHEHHTNVGDPDAGTAGARPACQNVPFR